MAAELDIFIDLQARRIVPGRASSGPVDLTFYQGGTYHIVLHGLLADDAAPLGTIYSLAGNEHTARDGTEARFRGAAGGSAVPGR
jgi:hypothetical protein